MRVRHNDPDLESAELDPNHRGPLDKVLVRALRKVLNLVRQVPNESELKRYPSLNFEKLKGNRSHQHSMRLNIQWRLIVEIEKCEGRNNNICVVMNIEDYH